MSGATAGVHPYDFDHVDLNLLSSSNHPALDNATTLRMVTPPVGSEWAVDRVQAGGPSQGKLFYTKLGESQGYFEIPSECNMAHFSFLGPADGEPALITLPWLPHLSIKHVRWGIEWAIGNRCISIMRGNFKILPQQEEELVSSSMLRWGNGDGTFFNPIVVSFKLLK